LVGHLAVAVVLVLMGVAGQAQSRYAAAGIADDRLVESFVADLQQAVAKDDRHAVAKMGQYPLTVLVGGMRLPVREAADLIEYYDTIFTADLKALIARASTGPGAAEAGRGIAVSPDGLALGDGAVIVQPVGQALQITFIRVPLGPIADAEPNVGEAPARRPRDRSAPRQPRRIRAGTKQAPVQLSGTLRQGHTDVYLVSARQNHLLDVRIHGVRERAIVARVLDARSGAPLDARARDGVRVWTGRVPATGDYRIEVVCLTTGGADVLTYSMAVVVQ
jgi:hypothetical protein